MLAIPPAREGAPSPRWWVEGSARPYHHHTVVGPILQRKGGRRVQRLTRTIGGRPRRQPTIAGSVLLNVYIDGFNVYYGCLRGTPFRWLDLGALCQRLFPRDTIHRIRYFTAIVSARPNDPRQPQRQLAYLRALATIPEVTIHRGRYL